jgi:DNA-directed RNA polymerase specialized sigma24 family protein
LTDEELMNAYQEGDMGAFETLYQRHSGRLFGFLVRRTGNRSAAGDLFQTTFLKLHRYRRRYDPKFPFLPWLFTIAQRVLVDHYRKTGMERREIPAEPAETGSGAELPSLEALNPLQREAIHLRFDEDQPFDEIARRLGTSAGNVRQIVSRAIRKLRGAR